MLIFDEATSALDSLTEEEINQTIRTKNCWKIRACIMPSGGSRSANGGPPDVLGTDPISLIVVGELINLAH